jgi:hypothetical protein
LPTLKNVWCDGTRPLVLEPFDLLARLCAAVPPAGFHMVRYFGVLSSHSSETALGRPEARGAGAVRGGASRRRPARARV